MAHIHWLSADNQMDAMVNSLMGRKASWGLKEATVFEQEVSRRSGKIKGNIQVIEVSV